MDYDLIIAISSAALAFLTFALVLATVLFAWIAWIQYRESVSPRIVIYPQILGDTICVVVDNRGEANAYGIRVQPVSDPVVDASSKILTADGVKIPVLGPGQRLAFIWYFWNAPESRSQPLDLACAYDLSPEGGKVRRAKFYIDPGAFDGSSIGFSKHPLSRIDERLSNINASIQRLIQDR